MGVYTVDGSGLVCKTSVLGLGWFGSNNSHKYNSVLVMCYHVREYVLSIFESCVIIIEIHSKA